MDFFEALVRYETRLWNHLDDRLRESGSVSLATLSALQVVDEHRGSCRVQELRADLAITVGAASKLVDRLERDGLAVRRPHPSDRRSSLVELASAGEAALSAGVEVLDVALALHLGDEAGVAQAATVLRRLDTRLRTSDLESAR